MRVEDFTKLYYTNPIHQFANNFVTVLTKYKVLFFDHLLFSNMNVGTYYCFFKYEYAFFGQGYCLISTTAKNIENIVLN